MKRAIVLFGRYPELGKAKTRLAQDVGPEETLLLYQSFYADTVRKLVRIPGCDVVAAIAGGPSHIVPPPDPIGENPFDTVRFIKQTGEEFGERLGSSIRRVLAMGYDRLVLVGADSPELRLSDMEMAFGLLDSHHVVLGPATDGGYYMIAMCRYHPELFQGVTWSTSIVLKQTISIGFKLGLKVCVAGPCQDIDTIEDLRQLAARRCRSRAESPCPATDAWLAGRLPGQVRPPLPLLEACRD